MDLQQKIERIIELMNVPECEKILTCEMERLERIMQKDIHLYRELKDGFRRKARRCLRVSGPGPGGGPDIYRFEVHREKGNSWRVTVLEPALPQGMRVDELIPPDLMRLMTSFRTDPGKVRHYTWSFQGPVGPRTFRLEFTNYSDRHVIGAIWELDRTLERAQEDWERGGIVVIDASDPGCRGKGDEYCYNELIYYMEKYPEVKAHVFNDFFYRIKPKLDKLAKRVI